VRLNGRAEIMAYLGRRYNRKNRRSWRWVRGHYVEVIHYLPGRSNQVWTTREEMDALDRQRSRTLDEVRAAQEQAKGEHGERTRGGNQGLFLLKLQRDIFPGMVKGKKA